MEHARKSDIIVSAIGHGDFDILIHKIRSLYDKILKYMEFKT